MIKIFDIYYILASEKLMNTKRTHYSHAKTQIESKRPYQTRSHQGQIEPED